MVETSSVIENFRDNPFQVINSKSVCMPAGKYFVGDLQYILKPEEFFYMKVGEKYKLLTTDREVLAFHCSISMPHDEFTGNVFRVRSGCLGLTLLEGLEQQWVKFECACIGNTPACMTMMEYIDLCGHIIEFDQDFVCSTDTDCHKQRDERYVQIEFGVQVCVWFKEGSYESSDEDSD
jgi:hypothetical protein